jgi:hypothetical protein
MWLAKLQDQHPGRIKFLTIGLLVAGFLAILLGIRLDPLEIGEEQYFSVPGEYEIDIPRPRFYAVFLENGQYPSTRVPLVKASGEIEYPDGVSFTFRPKGGVEAIPPRGRVGGWGPASEGKELVDALDFHFEKAGCYTLSIRQAGGPPKFVTLLYMQGRLSPTVCHVFTGVGIVLGFASIGLFTRGHWIKR